MVSFVHNDCLLSRWQLCVLGGKADTSTSSVSAYLGEEERIEE